jgi:predicted RNA-binding protein (virulence factor B family)
LSTFHEIPFALPAILFFEFMAELGRRNHLTILRSASPGFYLDGGADGEILLPRRYAPENAEPGQMLDVFVYRDSEDRLVATTETPLAMVDEFAVLRVVSLNADIGAFLDWGLSKDLLLPRREQSCALRVGQKVAVRVFVDPHSNRIVASMKLGRWLGKTPPRYHVHQEVRVLIANETPLGYNAIVGGAHRGLFYHSHLSGPLTPGDTVVAYIAEVRPDGNIDLSLDRSGYSRVKPLSEQILQALEESGGALPFHDKSSPEEIRAKFNVSKKAFKQALGALYRRKAIAIEETEIRLLPKEKKPGRSSR